MFNNLFFPEKRAVYEITWTKTVQPGGPQITMWSTHIVCWITYATNTHSEYVILIILAQQQWLHERASMLRYTYIVCLIFLSFIDIFFLISYFRASLLFPLTKEHGCVMTADEGCTDIQQCLSNSWDTCATCTVVPAIKRRCSENMKVNSYKQQTATSLRKYMPRSKNAN